MIGLGSLAMLMVVPCYKHRYYARPSGIYHHILVLDAHRKGLGHIRALDQGGAGLDRDLIVAHPHAPRVAPGFSGADVVFPGMPGAADDLALARVAVLARPRRLHEAGEPPLRQAT